MLEVIQTDDKGGSNGEDEQRELGLSQTTFDRPGPAERASLVQKTQIDQHLAGGSIALANVILTSGEENLVELKHLLAFHRAGVQGRPFRKIESIQPRTNFVENFA